MARCFREAIKAFALFILLAASLGPGRLGFLPDPALAGPSDSLDSISRDFERATKLNASGQYDLAIAAVSQIVDRYRSLTKGKEDENYAIIVNLLAAADYGAGRYADAETLFKQVL